MQLSEIVACLQGLAVDVDELFLLGGDEGLQGFQVVVETDSTGLLDDLAHEDHVGQGCKACVLGHLGGGDVEDFHIGALHLGFDQGGVHEDLAAGGNGIHKLLEGGQVHGHQYIGGGDDGRADRHVGQDNGAVGGAAAHLGAVGGQPGDVLVFHHALVGQEFTGKQDALAAETGNQNLMSHFASSFAADLSL